jgi:hypothetical protein
LNEFTVAVIPFGWRDADFGLDFMMRAHKVFAGGRLEILLSGVGLERFY